MHNHNWDSPRNTHFDLSKLMLARGKSMYLELAPSEGQSQCPATISAFVSNFLVFSGECRAPARRLHRGTRCICLMLAFTRMLILRKECYTLAGTVPDDRSQESGVRGQGSEVPMPSDHPRFYIAKVCAWKNKKNLNKYFYKKTGWFFFKKYLSVSFFLQPAATVISTYARHMMQ